MHDDGVTKTFAVITGGGTAGHVLPALAIADALVARGHQPAEIHYVGSERGIEARLLPDSPYEHTFLPGRGIQRRLTLANLGAVAGLLVALGRALRLVGRLKPSVVVAVGGYASVAVALAAVVRRVPVVVAEQNTSPGAANRLIARFAKASAVAFDGTPLPRAVVTGNPVRPEIAALDPARDKGEAKRRFGHDPGRRLVLVFGGSLGALRINEAVLAALPRWRDRDDLAVHHAVGARDWEVISAAIPTDTGPLEYRAVRYEEDMPAALAAADLAVTRAGSGTCFELLAAGLPSILIPSEVTTAGQQAGNAAVVERAGAAVVLPDRELDGARLAADVDELLADPNRLAAMSAAAVHAARPDAADRIAAIAEEHARRG
ncbi:MAG: UDP-N-acetylglucosamine--N-acetylmuramyl-(pentapeptide) pyrophosphoryl-undecaprenol [Nocardioidaceae bacterium]|nr:UDP-N-acetylglucosamine--N-acetylmuramyl-(pentapeptide) pyrophosphoryl-undecaprenol [Nocardioidaceae bacterium]